MALPKPADNSGRTLQGRLTRKVGPLPVWAWAAVILGAYLIYSRLQGAKAAVATGSTAVPVTDSTAGTVGSAAQAPASGAGTAADNLSGDLLAQLYGVNAGTIDSLTTQLLTSQSAVPASEGTVPTVGNGIAPGSISSAGAASAPAAVPAQAKAAAGHQTQSLAGRLVWDGLTFTTKTSFNAWARAHGTSPAAIFSKHPQAKALYSTLA